MEVCADQPAKPQPEDKSERKKEPSTSPTFNVLELLREPEAYLAKIHELNQRGVEKLRQQGGEGCQEAVKLLTKAEEMINIGRNVCKAMDSDIKICVAYNLACAYQGLWILQKCKRSCQQTTEEIESALSSLGALDQEVRVKLHLFLLKLKLQHCAILSQLGQHQKALEISKQSMKVLHQALQLVLGFVEGMQQNSVSNVPADKVKFTDTASKFALMLKSLIEAITEDITATRAKKPILYFWKNNPQNNQRLIKQEFGSKRIFTKDEEQRSPLGLQHENDWIEQFNIGMIMHMGAVSYSEFKRVPSFFQQLTKKALYEKVIFCSVVHFTIATEIRFVEDPNRSKDSKKFSAVTRSEAYKTSELYHLKAIEIMCKGISTCSPYLNHLISSYYKHYLQSLNQIEEHQNSQLQDPGSRKTSVHGRKPSQHQQQEYYRQQEQQLKSEPNAKPETESEPVSPMPHSQLPNSNFTSTTDGALESEVSDSPLRPAGTGFNKTKKSHQDERAKLKRRCRNGNSDLHSPVAAGKTPLSLGKSKKKNTRKDRSKSNTRCKTPENINLLRQSSNSKSKIPLSIIKRAFHDHGIKGISPKQVMLTQKTSTEINLVLKKQK